MLKIAKLKDLYYERSLRLLKTKVSDVMTKNILTCDYNDLSIKAVRLLLENSQLAVLIFKDARPFNLVTTFDLLRLSFEEVFDPSRDYLRFPVGELVKDKEFISLDPDSNLIEALNIMLNKCVRSVAVIKDKEVFGMCSVINLMEWYRNTHEETRK